MIKKLLVVCCIVFLICSCNSKDHSKIQVDTNVNCENYLGYDLLRVVEKPKWLPDSIDIQFLGRNGFLIIQDCKGNADLVLYDENENIILEGKFKESNIFKLRKVSSKTTTKVNIPVIDGSWHFNNFTADKPLNINDL